MTLLEGTLPQKRQSERDRERERERNPERKSERKRKREIRNERRWKESGRARHHRLHFSHRMCPFCECA